jgi:hypothetical protein
MFTIQFNALNRRRLWCLLVLLSLSGCSATYRFQYRYTMISPSGGTEGVEDDQVRIQLTPEPQTGVMQLTVANKLSRSIAIVWEQTRYIDPFGRRRQATETGAQWFFRPREWFANETSIVSGGTLSVQVHPGEHQTYNPLTVSRGAGGDVTLSTSPRPLLPTSGTTPTMGKRFQDREFRFILALRIGTNVTEYSFTFRITDVDVQ